MFFFGPRKYFRGVFKRRVRAAVAVAYWLTIGLTLLLCFIPGVPTVVIILLLITQKVMWAVNFAVACGCICKEDDVDGDKKQRYTNATEDRL